MKIEIYESGKDGKHYWRARAQNGRIVADGPQGYAKRAGANKAALSVVTGCREDVEVSVLSRNGTEEDRWFFNKDRMGE